MQDPAVHESHLSNSCYCILTNCNFHKTLLVPGYALIKIGIQGDFHGQWFIEH